MTPPVRERLIIPIASWLWPLAGAGLIWIMTLEYFLIDLQTACYVNAVPRRLTGSAGGQGTDLPGTFYTSI
jgi:hypothetical protein